MNVFKEARSQKGITQMELSRLVHVTQASISQWEVGKTLPDTKTIIELADIFGVSTDYLLGRTPNPTPTITEDTPYLRTTDSEKKLLESYRAAPKETQMIVCKILDIEHPAAKADRIKNRA